MAPHRLPITAIGTSLRGGAALIPPDPGASVLVALGALVVAQYNLHVMFLLSLVIGGGLLDLWTGARRARILERVGGGERFDRTVLDEGIKGKATILVVTLFFGVAFDGMLALTGSTFSLAVADVFRAYTPVMASLLGWRALREITSIMHNIQATPGGRDAILPSLTKLIDAMRYRLLNPGAGALPQERWGDRLSAEERAWVEEQLEERRQRGGERDR